MKLLLLTPCTTSSFKSLLLRQLATLCLVSASSGLSACAGEDPSPDSGDGETSSPTGGMGGSSNETNGETSEPGRPGEPDEPDEPSFDSLYEGCRALVTAQCERLSECGAYLGDCQTLGTESCPDVSFSPGSTRDADQIGACVKEWETFSCQDLYVSKTPECLTRGTRKSGEACVYGSQCESLICSGGNESCGECIPVGDGTSCSQGQLECPGFAHCEEGTCISDVRDPARPPFVPGPPSEPGQPCIFPCVDGYTCLDDSQSGDRICLPDLKDGEPCYEDGLSCGGGEFGPICDADYLCRERGKVGEVCAKDLNDRPYCVEGAGCNEEDKCALPGGPGTECLFTTSVGPALCGEGEQCVKWICHSRIERGGDCSGEYDSCEPGTICVAGACEADDTIDVFEEACR